MPNSLRCRLKNLVRKGLLSERDLERIIITNPMSKKEESMLLSSVYNEGYYKGLTEARKECKEKYERNMGEWLNKQVTNDYHVYGTCSLCHEVNRIGKACRSCGALMR